MITYRAYDVKLRLQSIIIFRIKLLLMAYSEEVKLNAFNWSDVVRCFATKFYNSNFFSKVLFFDAASAEKFL